jgi:membrane-associated protease RseP (regulator of RpoE activity)
MSIIGLALSTTAPTSPARLVEFHPPLLFLLLSHLLGPTLHIQLGPTTLWHPVLVASWIGILITSLNLIPAGQLDGGHILYALSPRIHRVLTYAVLALLIFLGIRYWLGWLLWTALLLLPGMRHPKVTDTTPLAPTLRLLPPIALLIFILSATPEPFSNSSLTNVLTRLLH